MTYAKWERHHLQAHNTVVPPASGLRSTVHGMMHTWWIAKFGWVCPWAHHLIYTHTHWHIPNTTQRSNNIKKTIYHTHLAFRERRARKRFSPVLRPFHSFCHPFPTRTHSTSVEREGSKRDTHICMTAQRLFIFSNCLRSFDKPFYWRECGRVGVREGKEKTIMSIPSRSRWLRRCGGRFVEIVRGKYNPLSLIKLKASFSLRWCPDDRGRKWDNAILSVPTPK